MTIGDLDKYRKKGLGVVFVPKFTTADRLKQIMDLRELRQIDIVHLCEPYCKTHKVKMGRNAISQYVAGKVEPRQNALYILGQALNVSEAWLMGFDVPMERDDNTSDTQPIAAIEMEACGIQSEDPATSSAPLMCDSITEKKFPKLYMREPRISKKTGGVAFAIKEYHSLNFAGKLKVNEYILDLSENPNYMETLDSSDSNKNTAES